jgi:hypothetical protein
VRREQGVFAVDLDANRPMCACSGRDDVVGVTYLAIERERDVRRSLKAVPCPEVSVTTEGICNYILTRNEISGLITISRPVVRVHIE